MSKSNNHHCTPDLFGEQKGDFSPFFHIQNQKELREILLKEMPQETFTPEEDLLEFSTFFHEEKQAEFLSKANEARVRRQKIAEEIRSHIDSLSSAVAALAKQLAMQPSSNIELSKNCALLTNFVHDKQEYIRNNILVLLNNKLLFLINDSTFLQIEKELFFFEAATKVLGTYHMNRERMRQRLLQYPPQNLISPLTLALQYYENTEHLLSSQLLIAAKAAKAHNTAKYINTLHETATCLYDTVGLLHAIGIEEAYVKIHSRT